MVPQALTDGNTRLAGAQRALSGFVLLLGDVSRNFGGVLNTEGMSPVKNVSTSKVMMQSFDASPKTGLAQGHMD